ncbi:WD40-repeat-containing domain protein [Scenedesmus sp. NREL 46B-D3]|nr:WD40-repeat-containing domain protein [Scenedesmus sp. NREL 46B-D3]
MPPARTALQRLKDAQRARQNAGNTGQRQYLASASDADNEAYMQNFNDAFSSLLTAAPGHLTASAATAPVTAAAATGALLPVADNSKQSTQTVTSNSNRPSRSSGRQAVTTTSRAAASSRPHRTCTARRGPCLQDTQDLGPSGSSQRTGSLQSIRAGMHTESNPSRVLQAAGMPVAKSGPPTGPLTSARPGWRVGPIHEAGVTVPLSDRPLLCSAANWSSNEVVIGSSDHGLYVVDAAAGKKRRTLYSKTTGHTQWVACVCCLPGGRVLSGGLDGRLWLWPAAGSAGCEIQAAHAAPVSKVACLTPAQPTGPATASGSSMLAVSCSYDKTVKVWDVSSSRCKPVAVLQGHAGPVLELVVHPGGRSIATGDRKGGLMCWDLGSGSSCWGAAAAHQGHISALAWSAARAPAQDAGNDGSCCVISGGQDGVVQVWDGRTGGCVATQAVHVGKQGRGAVSNIVTGCGSSGNLVVTAGADMTLRVMDAAQPCKPIHTVQLTDFPYTLTAVAADLVLCGCGDGSVHVVDLEAGRALYALVAGKAAVRAMEVSPAGDRVVCAGDDGCAVCYEFR